MQPVLIRSDPDVHDAARTTLGALGVLFAIGVAVWLYRDVRLAVIVVGALAFLVTVSWRPWLLPLATLAIVCLLPLPGRLGEHDPLPVHFHPYMLPPLVACMALLQAAARVLNPNGMEIKVRPRDGLAVVIGMFLAWGTFIQLRGLAQGNSTLFLYWELSYFLLFTTYFIWRSFFRQHGAEIQWVHILIGLAVLTAVEFAWVIAQSYTDIASFVLLRILTRQSQVPIFAFPLATWFLLTRKTTGTRLLGVGLLLVIVSHIFLTQQRSIWVAAVGMGVLFFTLYIFRHGFTTRNLLVWFGVVSLTGAFFAGVLIAAAWLFNTDLDMLLKRWEDLESLRDQSFLIRYFDWQKAMDMVGDDWFWGLGGGKLVAWVHSGFKFFYFDVSYGIAYLKGGLPFVLLMVAVYVGIALQGFRLYLTSAPMRHRLLGASITTILAGQLVVGLFASSMLYYRFIFIWMMLGAMATVLIERAQATPDSDESAGSSPVRTASHAQPTPKEDPS